MEEVKAKQIIEELKENYDELSREFSNTRAHLWTEFSELAEYVKNGDKVLDLGCGNGRLYELFKDRPVEYVGIDNSLRLIELAKKNQLPSKFQAPQFLVADALEMPFKNQEFDIIFSIAVLHHIPSVELRQQFLDNCYKALKPDGRLILTVWNFWQPRLLLKYRLWPTIFGFHRRELDPGDVLIPWKMRVPRSETLALHEKNLPPIFKIIDRYYHAFRHKELTKLLTGSGFKVEKRYYVRRGQKTDWLNGYNLVIIAKKLVDQFDFAQGLQPGQKLKNVQ